MKKKFFFFSFSMNINTNTCWKSLLSIIKTHKWKCIWSDDVKLIYDSTEYRITKCTLYCFFKQQAFIDFLLSKYCMEEFIFFFFLSSCIKSNYINPIKKRCVTCFCWLDHIACWLDPIVCWLDPIVCWSGPILIILLIHGFDYFLYVINDIGDNRNDLIFTYIIFLIVIDLL